MHNNEILDVTEGPLFKSLLDFREQVRLLGSDKVLMEMDDETFWALFKWFHKSDD